MSACVCVSVFRCVNYKWDTNWCVFTCMPLCIQHTIVQFVQWIVRREWRRMERKAVPAGSFIPCGEC